MRGAGSISKVTRTKIDPRLRALFKEVAREIVARDRDARRRGWSQNTIGEIERALVRAFLMGSDLDTTALIPERPAHLGLNWEEVPPRGRETLSHLTFRNKSFPVANAKGLCRILVEGRERWSQIYADGRVSDHSVSAGAVNPLIRLGLMARSADESEILVLTAKGRATCEAYWRRFDARDASLPRENLRR